MPTCLPTQLCTLVFAWVCAWLRRGLLGLALGGAGAAALALPALQLDDSQPSVSAWPSITVLAEADADADARLSLAQVLRRRADFLPPTGPSANLGVRREAVWLRLPLQLGQGDGRWVLDIDFPPLNQIDLHLLHQGQLLRSARLGNAMPFDQRPLPTRAHALALDLQPGQAYEVYLRVSTSSAMVLPISLSKAPAFHARESREQLLQGLLAGLGLALLTYSLMNWLSLRDPMFLFYALMLAGTGSLFFAYYGLAHQYVWNDLTGLRARLAPLSVLLAIGAGSQFAALALQARQRRPGVWRCLQLLTLLAAGVFVASATGLLDYRSTQLLAALLGPLPLLVALPLVCAQARQGEAAAVFMLLGWCAYTLGALAMAGLLRGHLPANFWTQHLFQWATLVEMMLWTRILSLRIQGLRRDAERAGLERQALLSQAQTDALTGLPNRRGLQLALDPALLRCRPDSLLAVYVLDLDGFKPINDRWGHDAGDALLVQVGARLRTLLRRGDGVARIGGDEFVIMAPGLADEHQAMALGRKVLDAFRLPFEVQGQVCRIGLSIGFALAPHDGLRTADLLKRADAAMYVGKQAGGHCMHRGGASIAMAGA